MSAPDRRAKLDRAHSDLSIRRQCALLGLARSGVYRKPRPANDDDLEAMRRIEALFTARPFFGARRIARQAGAAADAADGHRGRASKVGSTSAVAAHRSFAIGGASTWIARTF